MADYIIMCRDTVELSGIEWVQSLAALGYWGLSGAGPASTMKPGDRAIFYWTTKRQLIAQCIIQGPAVHVSEPVPSPFLITSRYLFPVSDLSVWDRPLPYAKVKTAGIKIPFLPSSVFPLNPAQFDELVALAMAKDATPTPAKGEDEADRSEWDAEFAKAIADHNEKVRHELRQRLLKMDPTEFEELIGHLLVALGFDGVEVTKRSGDGGIDVRGVLIAPGSIRIRLAVQVKRWQNNVHSPTVQQVRGSLGAHEQGLIITTSSFSPGAREEAARPDATPVALIDGEQLVGLLVEQGIGVIRSDFAALRLAL